MAYLSYVGAGKITSWKRVTIRRHIAVAVGILLVLAGIEYVASDPPRGISRAAVAQATAAAAASLTLVPVPDGSVATGTAAPVLALPGPGPGPRGIRGESRHLSGVSSGSAFGVSIELAWWCQHGLALEHGNFAGFLASLGSSLLRVGGRTANSITYQPRGKAGDPDILDDAEVRALFATARSGRARVLFTLPATASAQVVAAEARAIAREGGPTLAGFAIGNEPDLAVPARMARPSVADYQKRWRAAAIAVAAAAPTVPLFGPDLSRAGSRTQQDWLAAIVAVAPRPLAAVTLHFYATSLHHPAAGVPPTLAGLLGQTLRTRETAELAAAARSGPPHAEVWIDEANSAVGGGIPGVSDTRGAALWVADFLLRARSAGIGAVNLHIASGLGCQYYSPVCLSGAAAADTGVLRPEPSWSALTLMDLLDPEHVVPIPGLGALTGWSVTSPHQRSSVLINMTPRLLPVRVEGLPPAPRCHLIALLATDPTSTLAPSTTVRRCPAGGPSKRMWQLSVPPDSVLAVAL